MKRVLKVLGVLVAVLVVLAIAVPAIVVQFVDPNDYRDRIAAEVEAATGRKLTIAGDLHLSFFPWLGVETGAMTLGNAAGFGDRPFARVAGVQVRVRLAPLIHRELEMDTVRVEGLALHLARDAAGRGNWEDLAPREAAAPAPGGEPPALAALAVGGVEIRDASVTWDDAVSGEHATVDKLAVETGAIAANRPVDARVAFEFAARKADLSGRVDAHASVAIDPAGGVQRANGVVLEASIGGGAIGPQPIALSLAGDASFDGARGEAHMDALRLTVTGIEQAGMHAEVETAGALAVNLAGPKIDLRDLIGNAKVSGGALGEPGARVEVRGAVRADLAAGTVAAPDLRASVDSFDAAGIGVRRASVGADLAIGLERRTFAATKVRGAADLTGTALGGARAHVELSGEARADLASGRVSAPGVALAGNVAGLAPGDPLPFAAKADVAIADGRIGVEKLRLSVAGVKGDGKLSATTGAKPALDGELALEPFDLRALLARFGVAVPATADPNALAKASLGAKFRSDGKGATVKDLEVALGGTRIGGSVEVPDLAARRVRFDLAGGTIDADRYLPPPVAAPAKAAGPAGAAAAVAGLEAAVASLPRDTLRALDVEGRLRVERLEAHGLEMRKVELPIALHGGVLDLPATRMQVYGGSVTAKGRVDMSGPGIAIEQQKTLRGVKLGPILAALGVGADLGALGTASTNLDGAAKVTLDPTTHLAKIERFSVDLAAAGKGLPKDGIDAHLAFSGDADLAKQTATVPVLDLRLDDLHLAGKLELEQILGDPSYAGAVKIDPFAPRKLLARLGQPAPPTADPKALARADATLAFSGSTDSVRFESVAIGVDDTHAKGSASITSFRKPGYRFDLDVDALDADRYLPAGATRGKAATPGAAATALPLDALRALDLDGELRVGRLHISGLTLGPVRVRAHSKDGELRLNPLEADLYQGHYQGDIRVDARGKEAKLSTDERLTGVETGPLLRDLQGRELMSGRGDLTLALTGRGADVEALKRTVSGRATARFHDGAIYGIDVLGTLCKAFSGLSMTSLNKKDLLSGLLGMALPAIGSQGSGGTATGNRTEFAELSGTVDVRDGVATNRDLLMRSPLVRVEGSGTADLPRDRVDYTATAALVASCQGQGGRDFRDLRGIPIPIHVTGRLSQPNVQPPSMQEVAGAVQRLRSGPQSSQSQTVQPRQQPLQQVQPAPQQPAQPAPQPAQPSTPEQAVQQILKKGLRGLLGQ